MEQNTALKIGGVVALAAVYAGTRVNELRQPDPGPAPEASPPSGTPVPLMPRENRVTRMIIKDLVKGKGPIARPGYRVEVNYKGWLAAGMVFDQSKPGQPFHFLIGAHMVIPGWEEGITGMREGGRRKITIPPAKGYGEQGKGAIPPNATLIFDVQLLKVRKGPMMPLGRPPDRPGPATTVAVPPTVKLPTVSGREK